MSQPISFTVRPPASASYRPSPLGNGSSRGAPSRRLFEQNGHDEESDEEDHHSGSRRSSKPRDEKIEGFGKGRALGGEKPSGPLVIPALPNKDWRAHSSSNRVPSYRPEARDPNEEVETHERTGDGPQKSGLRNVARPIEIEPMGEEGEEDVKPDIKTEPEVASSSGAEVKIQPLTLEEQALQAILKGEVKMESEQERLRRELVIGGPNPLTEEEALKRDIDELPEMSTAEDYAAIPVSAFGEAMARGMGWNPNSSDRTKIHEPKLRPALLGLGATALVQKPPPPSRNGSSSSKKPQVTKRDSMKYNLGDSLIKKERNGENGSSGVSTPVNGSSRRPSPESDGSYAKRRREDDHDRYSKSTRYETDEERARRKAKEREREYETDEERARRKAKERERDYETEEERAKRKAKERERREGYDSDRARDEKADRRYRDDRDRRDRDYGDRRDRDRDDRNRRDRYDRDGDRRRDR
ncbi:hypothetical protein I203_100552 [Kwoniella mangroviensis CBS 8507]|uniref:uncharacterized protein n=1 Tax=Kwoniella mangroviensis CBS 8507 TaxID=1296122 RepID=UPI00080CF702|nr:uncharacterized protein I203_07127 [Kwoniella mangroviensis CBS 8507]OCF63806.1 hypothetical protein I203_07127 [Kwoniella mangroviensis CBS 8507]